VPTGGGGGGGGVQSSLAPSGSKGCRWFPRGGKRAQGPWFQPRYKKTQFGRPRKRGAWVGGGVGGCDWGFVCDGLGGWGWGPTPGVCCLVGG